MPHVWGYASDKRVREENQDSFGLFEVPLGLLAVVCDGMGGHVGGAVASALATREIYEHMAGAHGDPQSELQTAIERANTAVYDRSRKSRRLMGMGTTAVVALVREGALIVAHVGDSRAYFSRGGEAESITRDHTMVNLFVDAELLSPEDAASHPEAHVLARSLGVERAVEVDVQDLLPFEPGDTVILCSDGVHGFIKDGEFGAQDWREPQASIEGLFKLLRERDSDDNATMIVVSADGNESVVPLPFTEPPEVPEDDQADGGRLASVGMRSNPTIAPVDYDEPEPAPPPMPTPQPQIQFEEIGAPPPMDMEIGIGASQAPPPPSSHPMAPEPPGAPIGESYTIGADPEAPVVPADAPSERDLSKAKPVGGSNRGKILVGAGVLLLGVGALAAGGLYVMSQSGGPAPAPAPAAITVEQPPPTPAPAKEDTGAKTEGQAGSEGAAGAEGEAGTEAGTEGEAVAEVEPGTVEPEPEVAVEPAPVAEVPDPVEPEPAGEAAEGELAEGEAEGEGVAWLADPVEWAPEYTDEDIGYEIRAVPPPSENGGFYIHAQKPDLGRQGMHRAEKYVNAPPGGSTQIEIVKIAREGECGQAMERLQKAMDTSLDYASLYSQVWSCYNLGHQKKLYGVAITDMDSYAEHLVHFEGADRSTRGYSGSPWAAPAANGIDHRLEQWMSSEGENSFPLVMLDLIGAEKAAMDLAADMLLEAEAAAAFGRLSRHSTTETNYWARRVFITALAFKGNAGDLVAEHQPEAHSRIETLLNEATRGGLDNPSGVRLPAQVKAALLAGLGERPIRKVAVAEPKPEPTAPKPAPKPEPEDLRPVIYQGPPKR